jgi:2-oxoglutarate dehydrogenase E1 component
LNRNFRKPLVVFSPKLLLRYPKAVSSIKDLSKGGFQEVIDDPRGLHKQAKTVVLCSGKAYYEFVDEAEQRGADDMAFVRVEQLYPLPKKQIEAVLAKYAKLENLVWGQEEPENMGAWTYIAMNFRERKIDVVARPASAAPAAGAKEIHLRRLNRLYERLFSYSSKVKK